eukprot:scaffold627_cov125-Cylindrotheca_fusiformis.AAC.10
MTTNVVRAYISYRGSSSTEDQNNGKIRKFGGTTNPLFSAYVLLHSAHVETLCITELVSFSCFEKCTIVPQITPRIWRSVPDCTLYVVVLVEKRSILV